jgi:hypothetical protein
LHIVVENGFELSCSENVLATAGGFPFTFPLSPVTPVTPLKDPVAPSIRFGTSAE